MCQLMGPLVFKSLINFGKERLFKKAVGQPEPDVGRGVAMAIGLGLLVISASIGTHQVCPFLLGLLRLRDPHMCWVVFLAVNERRCPCPLCPHIVFVQARIETDAECSLKTYECRPRQPYVYRCEFVGSIPTSLCSYHIHCID